MKLTGKAKTDFLQWYNVGECFFNTVQNEIEQNAYIIEWFDSVKIDIHTDINPICYIGKIYVTGLIDPDYQDNYFHDCGRTHVLNQLILKANEIYNQIK